MSPCCADGRDASDVLLPTAALLLVSLFGALATGMVPRNGQTQFAVIAAPSAGLAEMTGLVATAGGSILDAGSLSNVIFARSDSPTFGSDLYRAGAWLVLDPALLRGCFGAGTTRIASRG